MLPLPKIDARRILLVLHGSIGDVTRALPLAGLLRAGYPNAFIAWSVEPASAPLLEGNPAIDEVILFDRRHWWKSVIGFLRQIHRRKFDLVLDLQRHLKSGVISRCSGAPHRLGFHRGDAKECNWLFNNLFIDRCGNQISKLDHYLKFAEFLGLPKAPLRWDFALSDVERNRVDMYLSDTDRFHSRLYSLVPDGKAKIGLPIKLPHALTCCGANTGSRWSCSVASTTGSWRSSL